LKSFEGALRCSPIIVLSKRSRIATPILSRHLNKLLM
jgi:hypothetical protein